MVLFSKVTSSGSTSGTNLFTEEVLPNNVYKSFPDDKKSSLLDRMSNRPLALMLRLL